MKKLLFTIAGLSQVMLVMAQGPRMGGAAIHTPGNQADQKAAAYIVRNQGIYQDATKGRVIVDVEGSMPNGRIPGVQGIHQAVQERPNQEK